MKTLMEFDGKVPVLGSQVFVAPNATLIGDVSVGAQGSIWFQAVLRGDTEGIVVGNMSNIQDHCMLHADHGYPCLIGDSVTVGHSAILHGCRVADRVLVGMGAIILNGAEIGKYSIIGAGTLVTERKKIPPRSLVMGTPGKIIREVTDEECEMIAASAAHYAEFAAKYQGLV